MGSPEADIRLRPGYKVDGRWHIIQKLGQGGFGAVYEVLDSQGKVKGSKALKLESIKSKDQVLKIEVAVLTAMRGTTNICKMYACGKNDRFNFMIMTLVGPSICNLRRKIPKQKFSISTTMVVMCQCLQALKDMHTVGWVHRDVKPSNFCIGQHDAESKRTIFMLDFGLSRFMLNDQKILRKARGNVGFRGTLRYCSLNAHKGMELGRHDDLISLLYMMIEMLTGTVPWKSITDTKQVEIEKDKSAESLYKGLPDKFKEIHQHLHSLLFGDTPPYDNFQEVIYQVLPKSQMDKECLDWDLAEKQKSENGVLAEMERDLSEVPRFVVVKSGEKDNLSCQENQSIRDLPISNFREKKK